MAIAPIQKRLLAGIIDLTVFLLLFSFAYFIISLEHQTFTGQNGTGYFYSVTIPNYIYLRILVYWIVFITLTEFKSGQSFGKWVLKIKVVRQDLTKTTLINTVTRHLFDIVDLTLLAGLIVALANKKTLRIGDLVAGTIVTVK